MLRLTITGNIIYQHLRHIVILLVLYAIVFLLSGLHSLPYTTLADNLPASLLSTLNLHVFHLLILTGILTAGLMMCATDQLHTRAVVWLSSGWTLLIVLTVFSSPFDITPLLDILTILLLVGYLGLSLRNQPVAAFLKVWRTGVILIVMCIAVGLMANEPWQTVIDLLRVQVAYAVTGISILFWLMTRWSNVRRRWAQDGVYIVSGFITVAGMLISLAPLGLPSVVDVLSGAIVPVCYMILGGHSYRALRDRNRDMSLSPHWIAIAVLFWMAGGGFLGTISVQSGIQPWFATTQLVRAQSGLMQWGLLAIVLSLVNYTGTYLRGGNRRITGYMPVWLVAFGIGFGSIVQGTTGVVEIYLRGFLRIEPAHVQLLLTPLTIIWLVWLSGVALGILIYALGFYARYPKQITVAQP